MFTVCTEMQKLRDYLDSKNITWNDISDNHYDTCWICRTHFMIHHDTWSVIHGYGTYGGFFEIDNDTGLLELMTSSLNDGDSIGFLTADMVIQYIEEVLPNVRS